MIPSVTPGTVPAGHGAAAPAGHVPTPWDTNSEWQD
jgi:hypothetical protein